MEYYISDKGWLIIEGLGQTKFFNETDLAWLTAGGEPRLNKAGYMCMPFGNDRVGDMYSDDESVTSEQ